jgi:photosystem II stability/assembly factor-like uncharacterized protein
MLALATAAAPPPLVAIVVALALASTVRLAAGTGSWTQLGPYGGDVNALAADPRHPGILYAGTLTSGAFKSVDGGANWSAASRGLPPWYVDALVVDPFQPSTVYAALGNGVARSLDAGASWSPGNLKATTFSLAADPSIPGMLYAGTTVGVFRSLDGGASWQPRNAGMPQYFSVKALAIDPVHPNVLYAGAAAGGILRSTDRGASWAFAGLASRSVNALVIDPRAPAVVYAGTDRGVFRTTDRGLTWTRLTRCATSALVIAGRSRRAVYAAGCGGIARSSDQGATWTIPGKELDGTDVNSIVVDPFEPGTLYAGASTSSGPGSALGGVFKSTDRAATWEASSRGLVDLSIDALAVDPNTPTNLYAVVRGVKKVFKSTNGGIEWSPLDLQPNGQGISALAIDPAEPSTVYAAASPILEKTIDAGASWTALPAPFILLLAVDPRAPATLYGEGAGDFYRSADGGSSWTTVGSVEDAFFYYQLAMDPSSTPSTLYAAGSVGLKPPQAKLVKSTDRGATWTAIEQDLPGTGVWSVGIDPAAPSTLYVGTDSGVYKSTDGGGSWTLLSRGPADWVPALVVPAPCTIYAESMGKGVLVSDDGGASWASVNRGLGSGRGSLLVADPRSPDKLYIGIDGGGLRTLTRRP